jgi:DNA-binding LytR/AlgR family response regulator
MKRRALIVTPSKQMFSPAAIADMVGILDVVDVVEPKDQQWAVDMHRPDVVVLLNPADVRGVVKEPEVAFGVMRPIGIPVPTGMEIRLSTEIVCLCGDNGYVRIHTIRGETLMMTRSIGECEEIFTPDKGFLRVHRSTIVNMQCIRAVHRGNMPSVRLSNGLCVDVSEKYKERFLAALTSVS